MVIENQVCTLEQAKKLKELGVTQNSFFAFISEGQLVSSHKNPKELELLAIATDFFSAFTVAELGEILPYGYDTMNTTHEGWHAYGLDGNDCIPGKTGFNTEAQARSEMIIYLIENNLTTIEEVNTRLKCI